MLSKMGRFRKKKVTRKERKREAKSLETRYEEAVAAVNAGMSYRTAASTYNVTAMTLHNRVKGVTNVRGRRPLLSMHTEYSLITLIYTLAEWGFGLNKHAVLRIVDSYLKNSDQANLFSQDTENARGPGDKWYKGFLKRHPDLRSRLAQNMPSDRARTVNKAVIVDFFSKLKDLCAQYSFLPEDMYNADESGFQCDHGKLRILCNKELQNAKKICGNNTKMSYTILACCNAIGDFMPVLILFKGVSLIGENIVGGPDGASYSVSASGWMEEENFTSWFKDIFVPHCNLRPDVYKLLTFDGHGSHISL